MIASDSSFRNNQCLNFTLCGKEKGIYPSIKRGEQEGVGRAHYNLREKDVLIPHDQSCMR